VQRVGVAGDLLQGVAGDTNALGYMGLAYYVENKERMKVVPVDDGDPANGAGPIEPSVATVRGGTYRPLSRPLFIYVNAQSLERPAVASFVQFYVDNAQALSSNAGYIPFDLPIYAKVRQRLDNRETGTAFGGTLKEDMELTAIMDLPVHNP
jgi:phosphate transport system substrate-binding protein